MQQAVLEKASIHVGIISVLSLLSDETVRMVTSSMHFHLKERKKDMLVSLQLAVSIPLVV